MNIKKLLRKKIVIVILSIIIFISILIYLKVSLKKTNEEVIVKEEIKEEENSLLKEEKDELKDELKDMYYIDVKGAVNSPGVYEIEKGKRVVDAIELAGGLTDNADTKLINLAKSIYDEMVIIVYTIDETTCKVEELDIDPTINDAYNDSIDNNTTSIININTATIEELTTLPGIGEAKAIQIIKYREEFGLFSAIEDIKNVSGIGESVFEKIKDYITV